MGVSSFAKCQRMTRFKIYWYFVQGLVKILRRWAPIKVFIHTLYLLCVHLLKNALRAQSFIPFVSLAQLIFSFKFLGCGCLPIAPDENNGFKVFQRVIFIWVWSKFSSCSRGLGSAYFFKIFCIHNTVYCIQYTCAEKIVYKIQNTVYNILNIK